MTRRSSTGPLEIASDTKVTADPPGTRLGGSSCCLRETGLRVEGHHHLSMATTASRRNPASCTDLASKVGGWEILTGEDSFAFLEDDLRHALSERANSFLV